MASTAKESRRLSKKHFIIPIFNQIRSYQSNEMTQFAYFMLESKGERLNDQYENNEALSLKIQKDMARDNATQEEFAEEEEEISQTKK